MSGWEEFKSDAGKLLSKAAVKAGEITDAAAARIKLQSLRLKLCEEYEKLGRLVYRANRESLDLSDKINEVTVAVDKLRAEIRRAQRDIDSRKEAAEQRARNKADDLGKEHENEPSDAENIAAEGEPDVT